MANDASDGTMDRMTDGGTMMHMQTLANKLATSTGMIP
jgi:hypothetical protein